MEIMAFCVYNFRQEISKIRQKCLLVSTMEAIISSSPSLAVFLSGLTLVLGNRALNPVNAFMVLSFMRFLNFQLSDNLGNGLQIMFEAFVSLSRIEEFLLLNELPLSSKHDTRLNSNAPRNDAFRTKPNFFCNGKNYANEETVIKGTPSVGFTQQVVSSTHAEDALVVSNLTINMNEGHKRDIISNISFVTPKSGLTVIGGRVGSGKSTLLSAIAGEVNLSSGTVSYPGTLAYVPQTPWVFSGTIKENILFGEDYDPEWYLTVVEACALKEDIDLFPDKNETIVCERGVVLSGGQKARVNLARAVYSCADVYVLDDPLSGVDQKVGDQVFRKCTCGLLVNKIRVLVSHHPRYIQEADEIILLENGRVLEKRRLQPEGPIYAEKNAFNTPVCEDKAQVDPPVIQPTSDKPKQLNNADEDRAIGTVSFRLYWDYFTSG